jgi:hypothetical protein
MPLTWLQRQSITHCMRPQETAAMTDALKPNHPAGESGR